MLYEVITPRRTLFLGADVQFLARKDQVRIADVVLMRNLTVVPGIARVALRQFPQGVAPLDGHDQVLIAEIILQQFGRDHNRKFFLLQLSEAGIAGLKSYNFV